MPKRKGQWPEVKGWVPYIASASKRPKKESDEPEFVPEKVDVPEGWKEKPFSKEENPHGRLFAESEFSVFFPAYREAYIKAVWPSVKAVLEKHHLKVELVLLGPDPNQMVVKTTKKTFDPFIILAARDMLKLLARSVELTHAQRVLEVEVTSDIIDIDLPKKTRFEKRRARLLGADGSTHQAMELLTDCHICIAGKSVACVGSYSGCKEVRKIVEDCVHHNIHPEYSMKVLEIKRELAKRPELKDRSWNSFLPKLKKKNVKRKKPFKIRQKKPYQHLPDSSRTPRKEDIAMEEGTYFINKKKDKKKSIKS